MPVLSGEDRGTAGGAQRVGAVAVRQPHSPLRDTVYLRRLVNTTTVGTDSMRGVVVAHDKENIGLHLGVRFWISLPNPFTSSRRRFKSSAFRALTSSRLSPSPRTPGFAVLFPV